MVYLIRVIKKNSAESTDFKYTSVIFNLRIMIIYCFNLLMVKILKFENLRHTRAQENALYNFSKLAVYVLQFNSTTPAFVHFR